MPNSIVRLLMRMACLAMTILIIKATFANARRASSPVPVPAESIISPASWLWPSSSDSVTFDEPPGKTDVQSQIQTANPSEEDYNWDPTPNHGGDFSPPIPHGMRLLS